MTLGLLSVNEVESLGLHGTVNERARKASAVDVVSSE